MIWVDYAILVIVALSAAVGFFRGFFREAIGLASWLIAFYLAFRFAQPAALMLEQWISTRSVRLAVAFGAIFILALIIGAIVNYLVGQFVDRTGFAGTDRILGSGFGLLRGVALLVLLALLAGLTPVPKDAWWRDSLFVGHLERGAIWVKGWLPQGLAREIRYNQPAPPSNPADTES